MGPWSPEPWVSSPVPVSCRVPCPVPSWVTAVRPSSRYIGSVPYSSTTGRSSTRSRVPPRPTVVPSAGSQVTVPVALTGSGISVP